MLFINIVVRVKMTSNQTFWTQIDKSHRVKW